MMVFRVPRSAAAALLALGLAVPAFAQERPSQATDVSAAEVATPSANVPIPKARPAPRKRVVTAAPARRPSPRFAPYWPYRPYERIAAHWPMLFIGVGF